MRWKGREESQNVDDRRGVSGKGLAIGGGLGSLILLLVMMLLGGDPAALQQALQGNGPGPGQPRQPSPAEDELASLARVILKDTEDVWAKLFR